MTDDRLVRLETILLAVKEDTDHIRDALFGNGQPGIKVRLDRLEQDANRRRWQVHTVSAAVIGAVGMYLRSLLSR